MASKIKRPALISFAQFVAIVVATIVLSLVVDFGRKAAANYRIQQERERLRLEVAAAQEEYQRLLERKAYVRTDEYVEKVAREELKWAKPGETVVVIKTIPRRAFPAPPPVQESPPVVKRASHWQEWLALLFD
ncbi:MAG: FtsB family cell division protein [Anaerolineae bacterium]